ncbi:hypothetical protein ACFWJW_00705 [Streptomyces sp. NPDC127097]|uniref:hypothetical protein n=1 Tax=Streptomyces sp. NPDC127097 TaxID=3347136 RepID=UPI0036495E15
MSPSDQDGDRLEVTISAREIYDQVTGARHDLRDMRQDLEAVIHTQEAQGNRVDRLERWMAALPLTLLGTLGALYLAATKGA